MSPRRGNLAKPTTSAIFPAQRTTGGSGMVTRNLRLTAFIVLAAVGLVPMLAAPALAADAVGMWLTGDKKGKVRIVNCGGALCGTLVWVQEPLDPETNKPKTDRNNVEVSLRGRPLIGVP